MFYFNHCMVRTQRLREAKYLAKCFSARKWPSWDLNLGLRGLTSCLAAPSHCYLLRLPHPHPPGRFCTWSSSRIQPLSPPFLREPGIGQGQQNQIILRPFQSAPAHQPVKTGIFFPRDSQATFPGCPTWLCMLMAVAAACSNKKNLHWASSSGQRADSRVWEPSSVEEAVLGG